MPVLRADRRLCLDRSLSRLVEETSEDAAIMVTAKGDEVPADLVKRLDLRVWSDGRVMQGPEPMPDAPPAPEPVAEVAPVEVAPVEGLVSPAGAMPEPKAKKLKRKRT